MGDSRVWPIRVVRRRLCCAVYVFGRKVYERAG